MFLVIGKGGKRNLDDCVFFQSCMAVYICIANI